MIYIEEENDLLVKINYCPTDGIGALFLLPEKAINRISSQRNFYAYSDLDIGFIDLSLLDVIYLERIVYSMQLKYYGEKQDPFSRS